MFSIGTDLVIRSSGGNKGCLQVPFYGEDKQSGLGIKAGMENLKWFKSMRNMLLLNFSLSMILFCCSEKYDLKIIQSNDQTKELTIVCKDSKYLIFDGKVDIQAIPSDGYVVNQGGVEYFNALVKWENEKVFIYYTYGIFEKSNGSDHILLSRISVKEFEELKSDSSYTYFYY
ncbi:hypothetical protein ACFSKL_06960 [Belliella marina]|uniref:Uncharacterized protein n=1 Tax=Belliella marina TaxID=1644146 RepID=A0ABW4VKA9_9BACT